MNVDKMTVSKGIGRYLTAIETHHVDSKRGGKRGVSLGAIGHGLPGWTTNPEHVAQAIVILTERASKGSAVARLKRQQRIIELTRVHEQLVHEDGGELHTFFVAHAAAWALDNHIGYSAFRAMGVTPDVLKAAGITRTFEP